MIKQSSRRSLRSFRSLSFRRKCAVRRSLLHLIASLLHLLRHYCTVLHRYCTRTSANHVPRHAPRRDISQIYACISVCTSGDICMSPKTVKLVKTGQNGQTGQNRSNWRVCTSGDICMSPPRCMRIYHGNVRIYLGCTEMYACICMIYIYIYFSPPRYTRAFACARACNRALADGITVALALVRASASATASPSAIALSPTARDYPSHCTVSPLRSHRGERMRCCHGDENVQNTAAAAAAFLSLFPPHSRLVHPRNSLLARLLFKKKSEDDDRLQP